MLGRHNQPKLSPHEWRWRYCLDCGERFRAKGKYQRYCHSGECGPNSKDNKHDNVPRGRVVTSRDKRAADVAKEEEQGRY